MKVRTRKRVHKQEPLPTVLGRVRQLLMPMVAGMAATKKDLMSWVQDAGLEALKEAFESDATALAGRKGKHSKDRVNHRWE